MENISLNKDLEAIIIMKKTALQISSITGLAVLILMVAVSANAQNEYRAHIPFDFTIGGKAYKAGNYVLDPLNPAAANTPVAFRDGSGGNSHIMMVAPGQDYSKLEVATLVFDRLETQYTLAGIRTPFFIVKLPQSKLLARTTLARNQNAQQTTVALTKKN
ncbi:MAG: hypothetical protein ABI857_07855 [Acidobacteriota bacterium]